MSSSTFPRFLWAFFLFLLFLFPLLPAASSSQCHSCLAQCKLLPDGRPDPAKCDCGNVAGGQEEVEMCTGASCFVKLELFPDESVAIVQKGCVQGLPRGTDGCNYSGQTESIHCYCQGEFCNERTKLDDYVPAGLSTLDCCECAHDEQCPEQGCTRSCRGNYCLVDFGANEQGCGHGVPRLQNFLRIPNYLDRLQGQMVCAHYQASTETVVNGCVCTEPSGNCNQRNRTWHHQMNDVLARRMDDLNYCYSLHARSEEEPLGADVYKKAATCEGHFCFASMSTREMAVEPDPADFDPESATNFVGVSKQRFELLGGCLKVDADEKVSLGCTVEYAQNSSEPLSVHCICDSHLCNYFELLQRATNGTIDEQEIPRVPSEIHRDSLQELQQEMMVNNHAWASSPFPIMALLLFPLLHLMFPLFPSNSVDDDDL